MASWKTGTINASGAASTFPTTALQAVGSPTTASFQSAAVPTNRAGLRVGTTVDYGGGRPEESTRPTHSRGRSPGLLLDVKADVVRFLKVQEAGRVRFRT